MHGGSPWQFEAIGTRWEITSTRPFSPTERDLVERTIAEYDHQWSRFRDDSLPAALATIPGRHPLPSTASDLLGLYDTLYELTDGAMSPCIGEALSHLGYDARVSLKPASGPAPSVQAWPEVRRANGWIETDHKVLLDVGAAGKGQLVDLVFGTLSPSHPDLCVDAGGDLRHQGRSLRVGLEHPTNSELAIGVIDLGDQAIAGSASNRRRWSDSLHHVLDARTAAPTIATIATWAIASDAMTADGLATALFFVPPSTLADSFDFSWVVVTADLRATWSPDLEGAIFR